MAELRISEIAELVKGKILKGDPQVFAKGYSIDSRTIKSGELFFALKGERDGHEFVGDALKNGGVGAVVSKNIEVLEENKTIIYVEDTLKALQDLAKEIVKRFKPTIVGITGSVGKTTVKESTFYLLSKFKRCIKSPGNLNNHIGLPLSILNISVEDEVAVLEMAMSSKGEIKFLTEIAPPYISVITNVNPVHLQFFSSIEEIALAKKEILDGTKEGGIAVLNGDDPLVRKISADFKGKKIFFGEGRENDIRIQDLKRDGEFGIEFSIFAGEERERFKLKPVTKPLVLNLLPAIGVSLAFGLKLKDISPFIADFKPFKMRGEILNLDKIILINDSYNSNPKALKTMLEELSWVKGKRKIAVLGDMLELGEMEEEFHKEIGRIVAELKLDNLLTVGKLASLIGEEAIKLGMEKERVRFFSDSESASEFLKNFVREGDVILVKGSRRLKMEIISERLKGAL